MKLLEKANLSKENAAESRRMIGKKRSYDSIDLKVHAFLKKG
jgi:hypothetical protein